MGFFSKGDYSNNSNVYNNLNLGQQDYHEPDDNVLSEDEDDDMMVNTLDDVSDMLKDTTKYKDVNNYVKAPKRITKRNYKTDKYRRYNRNNKMKWRFNQLPDILQLQIKCEYPNIMETTSKDKVHEIKMRMWELRRWYEKNKEFIEGVNY